uniref:Regulator of rDNA transcription 14 n=1 Tax=Blastobotrys adeninivorans TaxID=409370 RepID=A0A060TCF1_BLAAD
MSTNKTLERLLNRTLPDDETRLIQKKQKKSTAARRRAKVLRQEKEKIKEQTALASQDQKIARIAKRKKAVARLQSWEGKSEELQELQEEILRTRQEKVGVVSKAKSKVHNTPGLTPGLAPVGYEESDSE